VSAAYRATLPGEEARKYDEALPAALACLADIRAERAEIAARGGPEAVVGWAWRPGSPSREQLTARYARYQVEERQRRASAA
jgi:hypothetical protein